MDRFKLSSITVGVMGVLIVGGLLYMLSETETFGAQPYIRSTQLAASPANGECLTTDGNANVWSPCAEATGDGTWSTTSAAHWSSLGLGFSTTSADVWKAARNFFSTTSADYWETQQTARTADDLTNNSIEDLSDVAAITETLGDLLYWNGSSWADLATSSLNLTFSNILGTADISAQTNLTAGDALTLTNDDIDFDGGATPSGDLGGTWAAPSVTDDSHAHTGTTISSLDISADTNLTAGDGLTLTDDDLDCDTASASVFGCLSAASFQSFSNKWDLASATIPISKGGTGLTAVGASSTILTTNGTIMIWQSISSYIELIVSQITSIVLATNSVWDFRAATVKQDVYPAFFYATSTAWTGTTTIDLGPAPRAQTFNWVKCFTNTGTLNVSFNDGTNRANLFNASTTVGTTTLSTNNTFTNSEKRYVDIGTPASSPTRISCTLEISLD